MYYWREHAGHEIDCLLEEEGILKAIEIKAGQHIKPDFFK
jgi:predicted AAA+ superfamily ATPase